MTLGRPPTLHRINNLPLPNPIDDEYLLHSSTPNCQPDGVFPRTAFSVHNIKLAIILGDILDKVYNVPSKLASAQAGGTDSADNFENANELLRLDLVLENFSNELPQMLRWDRPGAVNTDLTLRRQTNILHAR